MIKKRPVFTQKKPIFHSKETNIDLVVQAAKQGCKTQPIFTQKRTMNNSKETICIYIYQGNIYIYIYIFNSKETYISFKRDL